MTEDQSVSQSSHSSPPQQTHNIPEKELSLRKIAPSVQLETEEHAGFNTHAFSLFLRERINTHTSTTKEARTTTTELTDA